MPYFLKLHFDPKASPATYKQGRLVADGTAPFGQGSLCTFVDGELVAEWTEIGAEQAATVDSRLLHKEKIFPVGDNCRVDPACPDRLLATASGYGSFSGGRIAVRDVLDIHQDIGPTTGNILFGGDVVVHGNVLPGFRIQARSVRIKGKVEGANIRSEESLLIEDGVCGARPSLIQSGRDAHVAYIENSTFLVSGSMLVDHDSLHCEIYAGRYLAVKGKLLGGRAACLRTIYVGEKLGSKYGAETRVVLGYDPFLLRQARLLEDDILALRTQIHQSLYQHGETVGVEADRRKLATIVRSKDNLWMSIEETMTFRTSRLVVPGEVRPDVDINIGPASLRVEDYLQNVHFTYLDRDIAIRSPALSGTSQAAPAHAAQA